MAVEKEDYEYARRLFNDRLYDLAGGQFLAFVDRYPSSPLASECLYLAGESMRRAGKPQRAAALLSRVVIEYPNSPHLADALFALSEIHQSSGNFAEAALTLERLPLLAPQSPRAAEAYLQAGLLHRRAGNLAACALDLERCLEVAGSDNLRDRARLELARTRLAQGQIDLANSLLRDFVRRQQLDSVAALAVLDLAAIRARVLDYAGAEELYAKIQQASVPASLKHLAALGRARLALDKGEWPQAEAMCRDLLKAQGVPDTLAWRARCLLAVALASQNGLVEALHAVEGDLGNLPLAAKRCVLAARLLLAEQSGDAARVSANAFQLFELSRTDSLARPWMAFSLAHLLPHSADPAAHAKALELARAWPAADSLYGLTLLVARSLARTPGGGVRGAALLSEFVLQHAHSPHVDNAIYLLARVLLEQGDVWQARAELVRLLSSYPESDVQSDALSLLDSLQHHDPLPPPRAFVGALSNALAASLEPGAERFLWATRAALEVARDYRLAAALARRALEAREPGTRTEALRLLARSYLGQARALQLAGRPGEAVPYADSARTVLEALKLRAPEAFGCEERAAYVRAIILGSLDAFHKLDALAAFDRDSTSATSAPGCAEPLLVHAQVLWGASDRGRNRTLAKEASRLAEAASAVGTDSLASEGLWLAIEAALASGDSSRARQLMERYLGRFAPRAPNWGRVSRQYAQILEGSGRFEDAAQRWAQLMRHRFYSPLALEAREGLGHCLARLGRYEEALAVLRASGPTFPADLWEPSVARLSPLEGESCRRVFAEADALAGLGRKREAVSVLARARSHLQPLTAECEAELLTRESALLAQVGDLGGAGFALEQLYRNPALPAQARERAGVEWLGVLFEQGRYADVADQGERLWSQAQNRATALRAAELAIVAALRLDRLDRARSWVARLEKDYGKGKETADVRARFAYEEGEYYFRQKEFDAALKAYERAASDFRQTEWGRRAEFAIARTHMTLNHTDKALEILTSLPQKYPDSEVARLAYLNLGAFYRQNKQLGNAILALNQVVTDSLRAERSTLQSAERELIRCLDEAGMYDREILLLRDYLRRFPDAEDRFDREVQLGTVLIRLNEYDRAIAHLKSLLPQAGRETKAEVQYWIGKAYLSKGDLESGIAEMLKVKYACPPTALPWDVTALFEAATAYLRLGDLDRAESLFQQVVREKGSASTFGRSALQRLQEIQEMRQKGLHRSL
ncbi:MAG: tetratricopeptide repeat protein [candidate division KSB1 bacterium]|nr:tetratricopeptide repeat protein [candidate division KSB1 bacterium]